MKRLWIAVGILALLCAASAGNTWFLHSTTEDLTGLLVQAQSLAGTGDWSGAAQLTGRACRDFQDLAFYLHITLRHSDIDAVEVSFQEVEQLLAHRERLGEYAAANARLLTQLQLLAESEAFTLKNIL